MRLCSLALLPVLAAVVGGGLAAPAAASPEAKPYIVVLKDSVSHPSDVAAQHRSAHAADVSFVYGAALKGYAARLTPAAHSRIVSDPRVEVVRPDGVVYATSTQVGATWGLDRLDTSPLVLDGNYGYGSDGSGVTAYILDTGIRRDHVDLQGRVLQGYTAIDDGRGTADCNGHGTHVAGTVGGTTYGVAKKVNLVPVRVLDCRGSGTYSGVIAGIDWVTKNAVRPAVANMSLGGPFDQVLNATVASSIGSGVTYAVAAGNSTADACGTSPASASDAITVSATGKDDVRASFANYGDCVDLFAPGVGITSAWHTSTKATNTISGTSMAAPHVAGAAARYLQKDPHAAPLVVRDAVVAASTQHLVTDPLSPKSNHLLFVADETPTADPGDAPAPVKGNKPTRK